MSKSPNHQLTKFLMAGSALVMLFLFVLVPVGASYLITNSRFRFPEPGPLYPEDAGLSVFPVEFSSNDGISLRGWWAAGDARRAVVIFVHGLNRSRLEMLERAAEANRRGYGVLLFDLRNHGESGRAYTTLGVFESLDVCAAAEFLSRQAPERSVVLWGVSMGASAAILAARRCPGFQAIVADSSFLSFSDTVAHHLRLIFHLPAFPVANLIVLLTEWRMNFDEESGNVEKAVRQIGNLPILFIAGGADRRMPPDIARRLAQASGSPLKPVFVVPGAGHGQAFRTSRPVYLKVVFEFLEEAAGN